MPVTLVRARPQRDETAAMADEVRAGLLARPRSLPCKYFYDAEGSRLFEQITRLPEYYLTRTEERLLESIADEVVGRTRPHELVELGSGTSRKLRLLLGAIERTGRLEGCTLLDISEPALRVSLERLAADHPGLRARGIVGDFVHDLAALGAGGGRLLAFLASTVGNLHPDREVPGFLRAAAAQLEPADAFLLGVDLVKDEAVLHAAYNDAAGVTARFNLNLLRVVNARLGADFDLQAFEHVAFYDHENAWIEMRLRATRATRARVPPADLELELAAGDFIRTEISCKYTRPSLERRLAGTGLGLEEWYPDPQQLFALALLRRSQGCPSFPPV